MAELKFEEALQRLEEIVEKMEGDELSLEEALEEYEKGVKLAGSCLKKLDAAEHRIEILKRDAEGILQAEQFSPVSEGELEE